MKKTVFYLVTLILAIFETLVVNAQNVGISDVNFTPNAQAILDLSAARKGFLAPRLELNSATDPINGTKPEGLMVYNEGGAIGVNGFYYWDGSVWKQIATVGTTLTGSGTLNYLAKWTPNGTTIGNSQLFDNGSFVGISTSSPQARLNVYSGAESATQTDFTQAVGSAGVLISTDYTDNTYTPGIFWSTQNNNNTKPKAGIYLSQANAGTKMYLSTSTDYTTGITNNGIVINDLGNVGIGSATPGTNLDVVGDARIGTATGGLFVTSQGSLRVNLRPSLGNGNVLISDDSGQVARGLLVENNGNVGIGTDVIGAKLTVDGQIKMNTGATAGYVPVSDATGVMTWTNPATLTTANDGDWTISGINQYSTVSGNVGIGTSTPGAKLEVASTEMRISSPTDAKIQLYGSGGNRGHIGWVAGVGFDLWNLDNSMIRFATTNAERMRIDAVGNVGIGGGTSAKLHITSAGTEDGYIRMENSVAGRHSKIGHDGTGMFFKVGNNGDTYRWLTSAGGSLMEINPTTTNVGIGISGPTAQLHTTGTVRFANYASGFLQVDGSGNLSVATGSGLFTAGTGLTWSGTTLNSLWTASGNNAYSNNTGNIGIGTSAPTEKLDVIGNIILGANGVDDATSIYSISTYSGASSINSGNGRELLIKAGPSDNNAAKRGGHLYLRPGTPTAPATTYGSVIIADQGGNVGVGTTTPNATLQVVGDARVGTSSTRFAYISTLGSYTGVVTNNGLMNIMDLRNNDGTAANYGTAIQFQSGDGTNPYISGKMVVATEGAWTSTASTRDSYMAFQTAKDGNNNEVIRITSEGNVGINNTAPNRKFVVAGTGTGVYEMQVGTGSLSQNAVLDVVASHDSRIFQAWDNNNLTTPRFIIERTGNVGIGTASAAYKLDVGGSAGFRTGGILNMYTSSENIRGQIQSVESGAGPGAGLIIATSGGENIAFKNGGVAGTDYMVITGSGRVGIGSNNPSYKLELPNNSATDQGQVRAYAYATYSDQRLKTDRETLAYGLDAIMALKPMSYYHHNSEFKDGKLLVSQEGSRTFGLLAQETFKVIPEIVNKPADENNDLWSVDYSKLGPVLVKAVQEQQVHIEKLESEIDLLKKQNADIDALRLEMETLKSALRKSKN